MVYLKWILVWPKLQFVFLAIFFSIVPFHAVFVVASEIKLILFIADPFIGLKLMMYPAHFENWIDFGHHLLIFIILVAFWLNETGQIWYFWTFFENTREEWPQIWHVDIFWPPSEQISVMDCWYFSFWHHFDFVKHVKFGVAGIFFRTHRRNGLKFDMLMHPDHLWNWLHLGHSLLVFLILAPFWLSETVKIWGFLRMQIRNSLKLGMLMYSDHLQNRLHFGYSLLIFPHFGAILT